MFINRFFRRQFCSNFTKNHMVLGPDGKYMTPTAYKKLLKKRAKQDFKQQKKFSSLATLKEDEEEMKDYSMHMYGDKQFDDKTFEAEIDKEISEYVGGEICLVSRVQGVWKVGKWVFVVLRYKGETM